jgi:hypothetical protein
MLRTMLPRQQVVDAIVEAHHKWNTQDREGWIAMWHPDAVIDDPVGAPTKHGSRRGELARASSGAVVRGAGRDPRVRERGCSPSHPSILGGSARHDRHRDLGARRRRPLHPQAY